MKDLIKIPLLHLDHPLGIFLSEMRVHGLVDADRVDREAHRKHREHLIVLLVDLPATTIHQFYRMANSWCNFMYQLLQNETGYKRARFQRK